jgi:cytochrome c-type biogenesis protein CcmH/NrfG
VSDCSARMSAERELQRRTDHRASDDKIANKRGEKKVAIKRGELILTLIAPAMISIGLLGAGSARAQAPSAPAARSLARTTAQMEVPL